MTRTTTGRSVFDMKYVLKRSQSQSRYQRLGKLIRVLLLNAWYTSACFNKGVGVGTKLLVSNLPISADVSFIEDLFTLIGDVRTVRIDYDPQTGKSSGVAHIEMSTPQQAQYCIEHFNGQNSHGHRLGVREDKPHVPQVRPAKLQRRTSKASLLQKHK